LSFDPIFWMCEEVVEMKEREREEEERGRDEWSSERV
jgi:hypothetical protein